MREEVVFTPVNYESWCPKTNRAGVVLSFIVNELQDAKLARKVNQKATMISMTYGCIEKIKNKAVRQSLSLMYMDKIKEQLRKSDLPENVIDHMVGMAKTMYREKILGLSGKANQAPNDERSVATKLNQGTKS